LSNRIEAAFSDDEGTTWSTVRTVATVNPQGEPFGYNRARRSILNAPYADVDEKTGAVYVTYFNGTTPLPALVPGPGPPAPPLVPGPLAKSGNILVSKSTDGGNTWSAPVKVNDDAGTTSHVFPVLQVNKHSDVYVGWLDRRRDSANVFTELWANVSKDGGATYGGDKVQTDIATTWFTRQDAAPNFGDYNSADLLGDNQFVMTWADGRFQPPYCTGTEAFCFAPCPPPLTVCPGGTTRFRPATPDSMFTISNGLGVGQGNGK
jgi:Neuraminidase (sialidase)